MGTNPTSSVFNPTDCEIVTNYLRKKVEQGENSSITEMDVYQDEPWLIPHVTPHPWFRVREWFYFFRCSRQVDRKRVPDVRRVPGRNGESEGGYWRDMDCKRCVVDDECAFVGFKENFMYHKNVKGKLYGSSTCWYITEYSLCEYPEWILCRFRHRPLPEMIDGKWCFVRPT